MSKSDICAVLAVFLAATGTARGEDAAETAKNGAQAYRICSACHSLKPEVNLSGPSLAGRWGERAATLEGYDRYTDALKSQDFIWDEDTLNAWLADPQAMVPGTTMLFRGVESDKTRTELIAFLRLAMAEGGYARVVKEGLIPENMAQGQIPPELSGVGDNQRITSIRHCRDAYHVATADGGRYPFWETNVRLKIDTSARGPGDTSPVLLRSGMAGDRVSVVFSSLETLNKQLTEECSK